jgi:hypothetical protein
VILKAMARGWSTFTTRWGVLVVASAALLAVVAPLQWLSALVGEALHEMAAATVELHKRGTQPTPEDMQVLAEQLQQSMGTCCGGACGNLILTLLILAPVVAGASICAAQAVRGKPALAHLGAGFGRFGASVWVGTLCVILGGGVVVVAGAVASAGARVGVTAAADLSAEVIGSAGEACVWIGVALLVVSMLWFSARLWLALYRLVDPQEVRLSAGKCVSWSWSRTAGAAQWQVLAVLLLLGVIAGAMQIPGEWLVLQENPRLRTAGWILSIGLALLVWLPYVLATSGALYAELAASGGDSQEPPTPPPFNGLDG